uniref:Uncharacterized protein n=1 Tax=Hyaloperonospora arabidopsidis (strain Emoy2) TaxID=559515 RepID=M4C076_HYAAE
MEACMKRLARVFQNKMTNYLSQNADISYASIRDSGYNSDTRTKSQYEIGKRIPLYSSYTLPNLCTWWLAQHPCRQGTLLSLQASEAFMGEKMIVLVSGGATYSECQVEAQDVAKNNVSVGPRIVVGPPTTFITTCQIICDQFYDNAYNARNTYVPVRVGPPSYLIDQNNGLLFDGLDQK